MNTLLSEIVEVIDKPKGAMNETMFSTKALNKKKKLDLKLNDAAIELDNLFDSLQRLSNIGALSKEVSDFIHELDTQREQETGKINKHDLIYTRRAYDGIEFALSNIKPVIEKIQNDKKFFTLSRDVIKKIKEKDDV